MNNVLELGEVAEFETVAAKPVEQTASTRMTTTLYDLIASIQAAVKSDEEDLVVPMVTHILQSGRATFLGEMKALAYQEL